VVDESRAESRVRMALVGGFALLALLLAAAGIYGVLAHEVAQRTQEIGVRLALGASPGEVLFGALRRGLGLASAGVVVGLVLAVALTRFLTGVLYGVEPADPLSMALGSGVLLAVAAVACWVPARRAARVDPVVALRCE
jgi:putative ABC transport system permease protein